jgi:hypothetical protein
MHKYSKGFSRIASLCALITRFRSEWSEERGLTNSQPDVLRIDAIESRSALGVSFLDISVND